jgi:hypothetical protein
MKLDINIFISIKYLELAFVFRKIYESPTNNLPLVSHLTGFIASILHPSRPATVPAPIIKK